MSERKEEAPPPPPPRSVSFWDCLALGKAKGISFFLFLLLSVGMGILFTKICRGLPPGPDAVLDSRHALAETGRLLEDPYPSHSRVNGRRPWVLEFSFTLPGGKEYRGYSYTFSHKLALSLGLRRSNLPVEYDPRDPERARIQGTKASFVPAWLFLLPTVFFAVTLILGLWWAASSLKLHSLAVYGRACKARLEEIRPVTGVNPPPWRVSWTLEEPLPGVPPQGSALIPRSHPFARKHKVGDPFWVVVDEVSGKAYPWIFKEKTADAFKGMDLGAGGKGGLR